ncbi:MAG: peptide chain release factor 2 [Miniphocaeibacter sp.]|uniref:peptide chain release factor 2 n=1 Tax=Miniphocaeibacter sp. TaxID=3100973 RepID=UPI003BAEFBAC
MDLYAVHEEISYLEETLKELGDSLDLPKLKDDIKTLEEKTMEEGFWDDSSKAQNLFDELKVKKEKAEKFYKIQEELEEVEVLLEMVKEEDTTAYDKEIENTLKKIEKVLEDFKIETMLSGEYDKNNAIFSINSGAGGTEAQDWTEMLLRMYTRWMDDHGFSHEITDYNRDTEGGIKSVTMVIKGYNAYGYLKSEKGVHRLVRISPFDTNKKRHTSFASVDVYPVIEDTDKIEIDPHDLRIDTYRASGAGGQHVNTTDSAVRITHIPTGVTVQCQSERSQISNRETAMSMLKARLIAIKEEENREKIEDIQGKYNKIAWGSQIRSYVFNPYTLVKDHRTNYEVGNIERVMDGDIDDFINEYLKLNAIKQKDK